MVQGGEHLASNVWSSIRTAAHHARLDQFFADTHDETQRAGREHLGTDLEKLPWSAHVCEQRRARVASYTVGATT